MSDHIEGETVITLTKPADLVRAIDAMLKQMNKSQRKHFLQWVKTKRQSYDFNYPQGFKPELPKEEIKNEKTTEPVVELTRTDAPPTIIVPS